MTRYEQLPAMQSALEASGRIGWKPYRYQPFGCSWIFWSPDNVEEALVGPDNKIVWVRYIYPPSCRLTERG